MLAATVHGCRIAEESTDDIREKERQTQTQTQTQTDRERLEVGRRRGGEEVWASFVCLMMVSGVAGWQIGLQESQYESETVSPSSCAPSIPRSTQSLEAPNGNRLSGSKLVRKE